MPTLREISASLLAIDDILATEGAENVDESIDAWLAQTTMDRDEKLDNYAALITHIEGRAGIRETESMRLHNLATQDAKAAERLRGRLKFFFQQHNLAKVETERYRLSLVTNGGQVPIEIAPGIEAKSAPEEFQNVSVTFNRIAIRDALNEGAVFSWAKFGERGQSIRIK